MCRPLTWAYYTKTDSKCPACYPINLAQLNKGDGIQAENIAFGSTISADGHASRQFDFMLANPPYGKNWANDAEAMGGKKNIADTRFVTTLPNNEELRMIPRTSDGQLLFLLNNVSKMKTDTPMGSRLVEVHNASTLSTGGAGSGESNARRYLFENDLVEAIIALPENMFYNTPLGTYIWILSNRKSPKRTGRVQLIDATKMKVQMRKNLGDKSSQLTPELRKSIVDLYLSMEENEISRVLENDDFGFWELNICQPSFDAAGNIRHKRNGEIMLDADTKDKKIVPFDYPGGWEAYFNHEVLPLQPNTVLVERKIGYSVSFTKYFYTPEELRKTDDLLGELDGIHKENSDLLARIFYAAVKNSMAASTPLVETNSKWLGKIPKHWHLSYLWQICSQQREINRENQEHNVLSLSHGTVIRKKDLDYGLVPANYLGYQIVNPGNIILRMTDLQNDQKSLRTALVRERGIITDAYICLTTTQNPRFVQLILHVYDISKYFYGLGGGVRQSIGFAEMQDMLIPIPPLEEQERIVNFVDTNCAKLQANINLLIDKLKKEINVLNLYKNQMAADIIVGRMRISDEEQN